MNQRSENVKQKKAIDLYKQFAEGAFSKDSLEDELARINAIGNAFDVKLKRIKITKRPIQQVSPTNQKQLSIKELQQKYNS
jgi:hypothetical protein